MNNSLTSMHQIFQLQYENMDRHRRVYAAMGELRSRLNRLERSNDREVAELASMVVDLVTLLMRDGE